MIGLHFIGIVVSVIVMAILFYDYDGNMIAETLTLHILQDSLTEKDRYISNVVSRRKRNTKVRDIDYQTPCVLVFMEITMTDHTRIDLVT